VLNRRRTHGNVRIAKQVDRHPIEPTSDLAFEASEEAYLATKRFRKPAPKPAPNFVAK
jgi:hypothetical protein